MELGPDPTPTQILRAAAQILCSAAQALRDEAEPPQQPLMWFAKHLIIGTTVTLTHGDADPADYTLTHAETAWLALASPEKAEPTAELLDGVADLLAISPDLTRQHVDGKPCDLPPCRILHHALTLANTIVWRHT
ncbi:hypothetical protein ACGFJT_37350 [Actinomadura geliboluensis]|uniref:hypothetical protein n=1 Tax=Actinomadura geliboluensis TaxID=882440 RepID=UPI003711CB91